MREARHKEHVKHPLMSSQTSALLRRIGEDTWEALQKAEPPNMTEIAQVPWLAYEVYGLIEPSHNELFEKMRSEKRRIYGELWPTDEAAAAGNDEEGALRPQPLGAADEAEATDEAATA